MIKGEVRLKSADDIKRIRESGKILAGIFSKISLMPLDGVSTWELDTIIDDQIVKKRARSAFKTVLGYDYASCISINSEVVHGIPEKRKFIKNGDLVKVDIGIALNGYFSDACRTFMVGRVGEVAERLTRSCSESLEKAISALIPGNRMGDLGSIIEDYAAGSGFSIIKTLAGHGVGFALHEPPIVPHYGKRGQGILLREGLVIALEPIFNEGSPDVVSGDDGWTLYTADGNLSAQFEETVAVTENGPLILTR